MTSTDELDDDESKIGRTYPPKMQRQLSSEAKSFLQSTAGQARRQFVLPKWMFALSFLLLVPFAAWIALAIGPTSLSSFTSSVEQSSAIGDCYWSLFGRDDECCKWVEHVSQYITAIQLPLTIFSRTMASLFIIEKRVL